jgi:photosystem I subunit 3
MFISLKHFRHFFLSFISSVILLLSFEQTTYADLNQLVPCKNSVSFQKRETNSVKKLENRLKLYQENTAEYTSIEKEISATKARFKRYSESSLLCGKEGLPRIIATGQWNHVNEFVLPGILFLYITGWIGWVGRKYLKYTVNLENSFENEIIINVPIALSIMNSGFLWPIDAYKELINGDLLANEEDITISPR